MINNSLQKHQIINAPIDYKVHSVIELLDARVVNNPNKIFLTSPGQFLENITYQELHDFSQNGAQYLKNIGLKRGDRINIIIPNSIEFLILYFSALRIGITVVPINQDLSSEEISFIILDSSSKVVFVESSYFEKIKIIQNKLSCLVIKTSSFPNFEIPKNNLTIDQKQNLITEISISDEAVIIYTSGTTGNPKGVVLSHLNLLSDAKAIAEWFEFSPKTKTLCILPLFHNNGQVVTLLAPLHAGGSTVIVKGKVSLMSFWGLIDRYNCTWTSVMPSILSILLSIPSKRKDNTMIGIICGGQVLKPAVQDQFEKTFGIPIFEGFGLTETTSFACFNKFPASNRKKGSVGYPLPVNEMKIVDEKDITLPQNSIGELCIRGHNIAVEYLDLPEKNAISFRNDWFHSGDFGYMDEEGCFFFKERIDSLIIKGGENIYPAEIENILYQYPDIVECAVIGIPDKLLGEDICAFVKLKQGASISEKDLILFCHNKIANFKLPKKIIFITENDNLKEIPKGPTQKILYKELKKYYLSNNK